jgi:hypothetical protein
VLDKNLSDEFFGLDQGGNEFKSTTIILPLFVGLRRCLDSESPLDRDPKLAAIGQIFSIGVGIVIQLLYFATVTPSEAECSRQTGRYGQSNGPDPQIGTQRADQVACLFALCRDQ